MVTMLVAMIALTGCSSSDDGTSQDNIRIISFRVNTTKNAHAMHEGGRALAPSEDGKSITAAWTKGDKVLVYRDYNGQGNFALTDGPDGTLEAESDGKSTRLVGDIPVNQNGDMNRYLLMYPETGIDYGGQTGTLQSKDDPNNSIEKRYDIMLATIDVDLSNGQNFCDVDADFENQQAIVKFILQDADGNALNASKLTINANDIIMSRVINRGFNTNYGNELVITPLAPKSELYVAISGITNKDMSLTANVGDDTYMCFVPNATYENSKFYNRPMVLAKNPYVNIAEGDKGKVICSDGTVCTKDEATAAGKTPVALIFYVGNEVGVYSYNHGLAIALTDCAEEKISFDSAPTAASNYTPEAPAGGTGWTVPSEAQWNKFFDYCGGKGFDAVNKALTDVGGTGFKSGGFYWSSTSQDEYDGKGAIFYEGQDANITVAAKASGFLVRPIYVF